MSRLHAPFVAACLGLAGAVQAADVSPHRVGDSLDTPAAQALLERYANRPKQPWREPNEANIPAGPAGEQIREGIDLLRNTSRRVGKLAPDATKRMNWNSLNCVNCHQAGPSGLPGSKRFTLALVNAVNDYPKFRHQVGQGDFARAAHHGHVWRRRRAHQRGRARVPGHHGLPALAGA